MKHTGRMHEPLREKIQKSPQKSVELGAVEARRNEAEEAIRESEQMLKFLVDNTREIILILDKRGRIIFANKKTLDDFGYSQEELIGKSIASFLTKDSLKKALYALAQEFFGRPQPEMEVQAKTKSGEIRRLSVAEGSAPVHEKGKLIGVMICASDITERKKDEEALKKRSDQLELIHHIQSEIPMNTDLETILIRAAESIGKSFGYYKISVNLYDPETDEIEYLTGWNRTGLPLPRGHRQKLGQGLIGKAGLRKQTIVANDVSKEPDFIPYHLAKTKAELIIPLLVQDKLIGVLDLQATQVDAFSNEDVSVLQAIANYVAYIIDEKQKEEAVQASEKRYRAMTERSSDVIALISSDGIILYMSPAAGRIFGFTPEERLGKTAFDRLHPDDLPSVKSRFAHLLKHPGESITVQVRMQYGDGTWRWIEATGTNLLTEPSVRAVVANYRDITERKMAENELHQTSLKLQQALGSIIDVVTSMVELKDPYTAGHQKRVGALARAIAMEMGLSKDQIDGIRVAGTIHDIGKIFIPGEILSKPGKLNEYEYSLIKGHSQAGYEILKEIKFPWPIAQIIHQHHERMDGSGHPQGLSGQSIILEARILAVADVVEAMSSHRPYRPAFGFEAALEEILQKRGILYDPNVVDICIKLFSENKLKFE